MAALAQSLAKTAGSMGELRNQVAQVELQDQVVSFLSRIFVSL